MRTSHLTLHATDRPGAPPLPTLMEAIMALAATMLRTVVVRSPVVMERIADDPPSPELHEVSVGTKIRLRSPTALLHWRRRLVGPPLDGEENDRGALHRA